jgi:hypothetical protein
LSADPDGCVKTFCDLCDVISFRADQFSTPMPGHPLKADLHASDGNETIKHYRERLEEGM